MIARVVAYLYRVLDIVSIERHSILSYRRCERILQQSYLVVVEVDICEDILQHDVEDIARLYKVVDTCRTLSYDNVLFRLRRLPVYLLRYRLVNADGQYQFSCVLTWLHLIEQPFLLLEELALQFSRFEVVERKRNLLVLVKLVIVVISEVGAFLRLHHPLHQFHSRVVLSRILLSLSPYRYALQGMSLGRLQLNHEVSYGFRINGNLLRLISHGAERYRPTVMPCYGEASASIARHHYMMPFVNGACIRNAVARGGINNLSCDVLCFHSYRD